MLRQQRNVLNQAAQGGRVDGEDVETVIKVLSEALLLHHVLQAAMGGGDYPDIHRHGKPPPDFFNFPLLKHPQDFRLQRQGHVADFVQKDCAAVGQLEFAGVAALERPGKGSLFVAEQLGFQQIVWNGRAVDADKGLVAAGAELMDRVGHQLLAGAGFSQDQNGGSCFGRRQNAFLQV
ncbi:hypothetical protein SDC9_114205 [bioreactor metagenome]|uniref:Uncharacterized protein n=1 Tax=bioreactor metagenome TaxID=1076179 RepID=A0A645BVW2_9ZZZZ